MSRRNSREGKARRRAERAARGREQSPASGGFSIELPPTLRLTHEDMADPETAAEVEQFHQRYPDGEVVISDDASCPHCAAAGIRVGEDGVIYPAGDH